VNGEPVRQLGTKVDPLHDHVSVDGKPVRAKRKLYVALHKPRGCVCTSCCPKSGTTFIQWDGWITTQRD
jgi:23S rRNA pseudouridine2605 synthase